MANKRCLEDLNTVLEYAKLELSEIKPVVQSIYISNELDHMPLTLLELDPKILNCLEKGQELVIRGEGEEGAVLCTQNATFDIKEAEISNSMLLVPGIKWSDELPDTGEQIINYSEVNSLKYTYFELRPCKGKTKKLKSLLLENPYSGKECENDEFHSTAKKYAFQDLLNLVQASAEEISQELVKIQAIQIENFWRILDFDFLSQVLNHIIQLCEENDWFKSGIPLEDCCQTLEELFSRDIVEHAIRCYGRQIQDKSNDADEEAMEIVADFYHLDEDKVCRFFAELCLKDAGKFNLEEFLAVWQQSVPDHMITNLDQIKGMALVDRNSRPQVIWYLPLADLPEDIGDRFSFLFRTREKWTIEDISPYIEDLTTDKLDVKGLLMKYARASMQNGVKVYNSKRPLT